MGRKKKSFAATSNNHSQQRSNSARVGFSSRVSEMLDMVDAMDDLVEPPPGTVHASAGKIPRQAVEIIQASNRSILNPQINGTVPKGQNTTPQGEAVPQASVSNGTGVPQPAPQAEAHPQIDADPQPQAWTQPAIFR